MMKARRDQDSREIAEAAAHIGRSVALKTAVLVGAGVIAILVMVVLHARHETDERPIGSFRELFVHGLIVDLRPLMLLIPVIGCVAVLLAGFVGWDAARRSTRPLGEALRRQREFVADASHELRTPLTVLDARVQTLQRRIASNTPLGDLPNRLRADTKALGGILDELLAESEQIERSAADVCSPVATAGLALSAIQPLATTAGVRVILEVDQGVGQHMIVTASESALRRCLVILLDNAIRHTPHGGATTISVSRLKSRASIQVADTGTGIVGIDPERLFQRFSHSQTGRRYGHGLGLSLAKDIALRCGGDLRLDHTGSDGTVLVVELPLKRHQRR